MTANATTALLGLLVTRCVISAAGGIAVVSSDTVTARVIVAGSTVMAAPRAIAKSPGTSTDSADVVCSPSSRYALRTSAPVSTTQVPEPCREASQPSATNSAYAFATVLWVKPRSAARLRDGGSTVPGTSRRDCTASRRAVISRSDAGGAGPDDMPQVEM
jgi:hypothetical protein